MTQAQPTLRAIALTELKVSPTAPQAERRKQFDKAAIGELADSLKTVTQLQPILVRPMNGHFEIVAGERRFLAAKQAGLPALDATVKDFTDEQVLEIQLVENLQREGLHELVEAEGYEQLHKFGHSAEEIAEKVGKSKAYVYARMKLLALDPATRDAFRNNRISASIALLIARIPVASVQRQALGEVMSPRYRDEPMSYRSARDHIEQNFMLRLKDAPFPTGDATLLPAAGACGACPKRTGNQPELFEDVKGADVCTDPVCFKLKREAWAKLQIAAAKDAGKEIISDTDAKKAVSPYSDESLNYNSGLAQLDDRCPDDPKNRTYKQLLGKDAVTKLLKLPKSGDVIEVIDKAAALRQLKKDGIIKTPAPMRSSAPKVDAKEKKREQDYLNRLFLAIHAKAPKKLSRETLLALCDHELDVMGVSCEAFETAWGWKDGAGLTELKKLTDEQLCQVLFELQLLEYGYLSAPVLEKAAKQLGVDAKAIRKEAAAAVETAKPAAKKKAKGKGK
jgi:ParB/RepB/Spo0J family partition protein